MDNIFANLFRYRKREVTPGVPVTTDPNHASNQTQVASGDYQERIAYVRGPANYSEFLNIKTPFYSWNKSNLGYNVYSCIGGFDLLVFCLIFLSMFS